MDGELELLGERIAEQAAHFDAAMHRILTDLREFDERGGWHVQGADSCAHWLSWRVGWDLVTSRERVRVARKLADFSVIDDALRRGEISYSKVRALLRVATPANEALLLDHARLMTASQLEKLSRKYALVQRHCQDPHPLCDEQRRYVRRRDTDDGMVKIEAVLHPEEAELVWTMLNHAATQLAREPLAPASDDSAESRNERSVPGVAMLPTRRDADASQHRPVAESPRAAHPCCAVEGPSRWGVADVADHERDASAESRAVPLPPETASAPHLGPISVLGSDASAESRAVPLPPEATPDSYLGLLSVQGSDASAESRAVFTSPDPATMLPHHIEPAEHDDSVQSREVAESRSLLDRLLDEADALRAAEADSHHEPQSSSRAPTPVPGTSILHQRADAAKRAFSRADALIALAQAYLRGDRPHRAPIEITLTIPESSLHTDVVAPGGVDEAGKVGDVDKIGDIGKVGEVSKIGDVSEVGEIGESFISREAARRLACDAGVVEVVEDDHGVPLSVGRKRRTIAGALKRALYKRDSACTYPGCTHRIFLEGHHIKHWADGGETSLMNTALLCSLHHRYVHEYGYAIELGPDQRPRFRDPHGRLVAAVPERPVMADVGWPQIRAENEPLDIDADTIACGWDGRPVDYGTIVGHLVVADGLS